MGPAGTGSEQTLRPAAVPLSPSVAQGNLGFHHRTLVSKHFPDSSSPLLALVSLGISSSESVVSASNTISPKRLDAVSPHQEILTGIRSWGLYLQQGIAKA